MIFRYLSYVEYIISKFSDDRFLDVTNVEFYRALKMDKSVKHIFYKDMMKQNNSDIPLFSQLNKEKAAYLRNKYRSHFPLNDFRPFFYNGKKFVLVVNGKMDFETPFSNAVNVHENLQNSSLILLPLTGHNLVQSSCYRFIFKMFSENNYLPTELESCITDNSQESFPWDSNAYGFDIYRYPDFEFNTKSYIDKVTAIKKLLKRELIKSSFLDFNQNRIKV
ncbi:hypothetical protein ROZALSC1DRAFT_22896 [Rozella allomycis CSF55]|nr:hypothetical protein ROZALSC1DRAFT_22896 [Rozella allomycis CSF55]